MPSVQERRAPPLATSLKQQDDGLECLDLLGDGTDGGAGQVKSSVVPWMDNARQIVTVGTTDTIGL